MMYKSSLLKVLLALIILSLSMSVDALNNRRGSNNTSNNGTSVVEEAAKGVCKKKDKSDDKDKDKKDKKKDKKNKDSKDNLQSEKDLSKNETPKTTVQASKDDIELTVTGEGKTKEDAKLAALRNALEQAYGVFVSSNTQLLNDEIVKDEIVSISAGIIKHYEILAGSANGEMYDVVVKAIVTPGKLVSYAKQKGAPTEFAVDGGTLGANVRLEKMNRENALKAMNSLRQMQINLLPDCFDYEISDMSEIQGSRQSKDEYEVYFDIVVYLNENAQNLFEIQKQIYDLSLVYAQNTKTMNHNFNNKDRLQKWPVIYKVESAILNQFYIEDDLKMIHFYVGKEGEKDEYNIYPEGVWKSDSKVIRFVKSLNDHAGVSSYDGHRAYFIGFAGAALCYNPVGFSFTKGFVYEETDPYDDYDSPDEFYATPQQDRMHLSLDAYFNKASEGHFEKMVVMRIPVCFSYSLDQVEKLTGIKLIPISKND